MTYDVEQWKGRRILVVGDGMLDKYHFGEIKRLNPENPLAPLFKKSYTDNRLGGALNVAHNCQALGGSVTAVSVTGDDRNGQELEALVKKEGIDLKRIIDPSRRTTTKIRYIENSRFAIAFRDDEEDTRSIELEISRKLFSALEETEPEAVIVSDYDKGMFPQQVGEEIVRRYQERNIPIFVDCKPNNVAWFYGATLIKPNIKEAKEFVRFGEIKKTPEGKHDRRDLEALCNQVKEAMGIPYVVMTCSGEGIMCLDVNNEISFIQPNEGQEVIDVTGAGDTVIAVLGLYGATHLSLQNFNLEEATRLAHIAASIKVKKVGTSAVSVNELKKRLQSLEHITS